MAIDLSELTYDPDFCTTFQIENHSLTWEKGRPATSSTTITVTGIAGPSSPKDLEMVEEGDRVHGPKTFWTAMAAMKISDTLTTSDVIIWRGQRYKLLHVWDYTDNGFIKAIGDRLGEEEVPDADVQGT